MKSKSVILKVLPTIFNILRVIMIVGGVCSLLLAAQRFFKSDYVELTAPLKIAKQVVSTGISPKTANIKDISVETTIPLLKASLKINFWVVIGTYLYLISTCLTIVVQMQNLRDFFNSIKIGQPFDPKNVNRLRIIAATFLAFGIINAIKQVVINILLTQEINNLHFSYLYWSVAFMGFMWAIALYIVADVFKYGFLLKQENEEFV